MRRQQTLKMEVFKSIAELRRTMLRAQKLGVPCLTELTFALNKFAAYYETNKNKPKMNTASKALPKKYQF